MSGLMDKMWIEMGASRTCGGQQVFIYEREGATFTSLALQHPSIE